MKIKIKIGMKLYITAAVSALFWLLCLVGVLELKSFAFTASWVISALLSQLILLFSSCVKITVYKEWIADIVLPLVFSVITFSLGQGLLGLPVCRISFLTFIINLVFIYFLYSAFLAATGRCRAGYAISAAILFLFHFLNYAVWVFRGWEFTINDFYSVKNAADIANNYSLVLTWRALLCVAIFASLMLLIFSASLPDKTDSQRKKLRRVSLVGVLVSFTGILLAMLFSTNKIQHCGANGTMYNGATFDLFVEMRESRVRPSEGYSAERAAEILRQYDGAGESVSDPPHIIVVMSESFADLSVLGELSLQGGDPYEFFNSLSENTVRGNAISSVYGGGTATSEWEFLTGNSAAFIPQGSIAYQQYVGDHAWSILDTLEKENYTTVAMHPYQRTFWKRDVIYEIMGFDEMWFQDELTSADTLRGFITDRSFYSDIITRFEQRQEGERLFMFNITMQNHSAYDIEGFDASVTTGNPEWADVDQYLSLVKLSDDALRGLVSYFEGVDEPVMLVVFGDHHPNLNADFYSTLFNTAYPSFEQEMQKQTVPFIIWTNYEQESSTGELVGLNSLAALVLERAGIATSPYLSFLSAMREDIPALNAFGYWSRENERFVRLEDAAGVEAEWLESYKILQYNNLFDKKGRLAAFEYNT